jgi:hypothetical protein
MKSVHKFFIKRNIYSIVFSVLLSVVFVALGVGAATTISTSITTDGALTVNGNSTLGDAVGDSVTANAYFTQLRVGTGSTFANIGTVGADELGVEGAVEIDGVAWLTGGLVSAASSTASGAFNVHGVLQASSTALLGSTVNVYGTGTSTFIGGVDTARLNVSATSTFSSGATTTLSVISTDSNSGGCLELWGTDASPYRIYVAATSSASVDFRNLVVEAGRCQ